MNHPTNTVDMIDHCGDDHGQNVQNCSNDEFGTDKDESSFSSQELEVSSSSADMMEMDLKPQLLDLPEEILERILSFLSPYNDSDSAKLVCHQWNRVIKSLIKQFKRVFYQRLSSCNIGWTEVFQGQAQGSRNTDSPNSCLRFSSISDRFSHSCAYLNGSMYVFGGCTSTNTTFNDLWRLDLTTRRWVRPVAMGSYPSPKACATMVVYKGQLVLFGGWSHPIPYPLHQSANYFSELHMYDPANNRWSLLLSIGPEPDALGGHSASIVGNMMVVFGGSPRPGQGSNKLWVYDFDEALWTNPKVKADVIPEPRYGQYQCTLDDHHILIMGGCGGPNKLFGDFYILTLDTESIWYWTKLEVHHSEFAPRQTWCHAVCKVEDKIVVLCKSSKPRESLNVKPSIFHVEGPLKPNNSPENKTMAPPSSSSSSSPTENEQLSPDGNHQVPKVTSEVNSAADNQAAAPCSNNRNLLALQQRLHRECVNLTDRDSHQHNSDLDNDIPEGQILRLQNRANQNDDVNPQPHHQHPFSPHRHEQHNQPHAGQLRRVNQPPGRERLSMPSIRPNASNNRQKQLEALQRQEELLRSKSKALAAARQKSAEGSSAAECQMEEEVSSTVVVKNRMDVHVVDISSCLSSGIVDWKAESMLQPVGAPMETLCCSLVEGRAELILFGGVARETTIPMAQNSALNKLYILHV